MNKQKKKKNKTKERSKVKKDYLVSILVKAPIPRQLRQKLDRRERVIYNSTPMWASARVASSNIMKA